MVVRYPLELATLAALATVFFYADTEGHLLLTTVELLALLAVLLKIRLTRRLLVLTFWGQHVRRTWRRAIRVADVSAFRGGVPVVLRLRHTRAGERLKVALPAGATVRDLEAASEVLAAALEVRDVRVVRDPGNACLATVSIIRRDSLAVDVEAWPFLDADSTSLWDPIPIGIDEDGEPVSVSLAERNVLLGGEPGAGKSAALSLLVATAALDPTVRLHLLDGKLVELACWRGVADHHVGVSTAEANEVLRDLQTIMDERYEALLACRLRKVGRESALPQHVVVVDELAHYLLASDRKERTEFAELMRDLVARGRAAGIIVLAATQKPSHDVIPTALRDLFGFRWALRCSTPQASDTVLGSGWASAGFSAADVDPALRGVGYLLHEGGTPVRLRSHYLDDDQLELLASRAETLRAEASADQLTGEVES